MSMLLASVQRRVPSIFSWFGVGHAKIFGFGHHFWVPLVMAWLAGLTLIGFSWYFARDLKKVPGFAQGVMEMLVLGLYDFFESVLGEHTDRYIPLLGTMFLYILIMNYWPLIPGMHAATATYALPAGLAIVTFLTTQYEGVRANGLFSYLKHFAEPIYLAPIMLVIHLVEEIVRPLSLATRLFGNIMGEDTLLAAMISLMVMSGAFYIPAQFPLYFLTLLAGLIQAAIFTILSAVYIAGAIGAFDEDH